MKSMRELSVFGGDFYVEVWFFVMMEVFIMVIEVLISKCFYIQKWNAF